MVEQQGRHEASFSAIRQQLEAVHHLTGIRAAERLHEGRHRGHIARVDRSIRLDGARFQTLAEGRDVLAPRPHRQQKPTQRENQGEDADVTDGQELEGDEDEDRRHPLAETLDKDVDEGLRLDPELLGNRHEQELAGRLVDRVPEAPLADKEHPDQREDRSRREDNGQHNHRLRGEDGGRQYAHADADTEGSVDPPGEDQLEEEADHADQAEGDTDHRGALIKVVGVNVDPPEELPTH